MSSVVPCIPANTSSWSQISALDGVSFVLAFRWSQREGHWILDVADAEGVAIVSGLALVTGQPLLRGVIDPRRPAGELVVVDTTSAWDVDPGFDDLGERFRLAYVSAAEIAAGVELA